MLRFLTATDFSKKKRRPSDDFYRYNVRLKKDIRKRLKHQGWIPVNTVTRTTGIKGIARMIKEVIDLKWYDCYLDILVLTYLRGTVVTFVKKDQAVCLVTILKEGEEPDIAWLFEEETRLRFLKGMEYSVSNDKKPDIKDQEEDLLKELTAAGLF